MTQKILLLLFCGAALLPVGAGCRQRQCCRTDSFSVPPPPPPVPVPALYTPPCSNGP